MIAPERLAQIGFRVDGDPPDEILDEVIAWAERNHMVFWRLFDDGMVAAVIPTLFQDRIVIGPALAATVDRGYCYADRARAIVAIGEMTVSRDEPQGWHKAVHDGRRRPDGDPAREFTDRERYG